MIVAWVTVLPGLSHLSERNSPLDRIRNQALFIFSVKIAAPNSTNECKTKPTQNSLKKMELELPAMLGFEQTLLSEQNATQWVGTPHHQLAEVIHSVRIRRRQAILKSNPMVRR